MKGHARLLMLVITSLFALNAQQAFSQSTIFRVPTTDTVAKGKASFEFDYHARQPNLLAIDRIDTVSPRVLGGITRNVEIGMNLAIQRTDFEAVPVFHPKDDATINPLLETNIKWKFASNGKLGVAASVGGIVMTPLNHRTSDHPYALIYGNFSKKITAGSFGPRFTAGPYAVVAGRDSWRGQRAGALLGYEQPIHAGVQIVADWYSGQNQVGYLTPGIAFALPGQSSISAGYSVGNDSYGNDRTNRFPVVRYKVRL